MRLALLAIALVTASPAAAQGVDRWRPLIAEASLRFGVPTRWIERVMRAESAGWTTLNGRPIRSRAGAMGLMQLMPSTWADMRARLRLGDDPDDPRDNIIAGTCYLRLLYDRFGYPDLFAAYNAGPARYAAYLINKQPLPRETVAYLRAVAGSSLRDATPVVPSLVAFRREDRPPDRAGQNAAPTAPAPPTVFAIRKPNP